MQKNHKPRTLAYHLAHVIPTSVLKDLAPAGAPQSTAKPTFKLTGPFKDMDFDSDYHGDW